MQPVRQLPNSSAEHHSELSWDAFIHPSRFNAHLDEETSGAIANCLMGPQPADEPRMDCACSRPDFQLTLGLVKSLLNWAFFPIVLRGYLPASGYLSQSFKSASLN